MDTGSKIFELFSTIFVVAAGVAIVSVLVSRNANTAGVLQAFFSGQNNALAVAVSPVTGTKITTDLSYPQESGFGDLGNPGRDFGFGNF